MTTPPAHGRPAFRAGARFQRDRLTGKAFVLFPEGMLELNESGTGIAELVDGARTLQDIAEILARKFDAPADLILGDVTEYIVRLRDRGLVELRE